MSSIPQKVFRAYPEDIQSVFARKEISHTPCIHCGELFNNFVPTKHPLMYTELSNGKFIWWHISPSCTPDNPEEYEN